MSLEDVIKRKLEEQKKTELMLKKLDAQKNAEQPTQKSGSTGMDFLQAGALKNIDLGKEFQDGYQFGDIAKTELAFKKAVAQTILGTYLDNSLNMWKGIGGTVEGVVDLGMYGVAGIQKATGHEKAAEKTKKAAQADFFGETLLGDALEFVNKSSVLGNTSKSIAAGIGQGALTVGLGMLTGGLGAAASTAITTGVTGLSSMGQGMTEAYGGNATDEEAALYGLISGVVDAGTELMTGGLGKGANAIGIGKGIGGIDDMIASGLTKNIKNKFAKNLAQMGVKAVGEGVEEALSYAGQTLAKQWTYLSEKELKELWSNQELLENFVVGTLTSAFMQAGDAADATAKGRDFVTGRTDAEQTVIDKLYKDRVAAQEKDGKKLTTKEKGQILDAVELEYERGEIAVEDIEAALGGDSYQKYTEMAKQQKDMQAEFDQLNGMKKSDMTGAQEDRLQELRQQLAAMKQEDAAGKLKKQYLQETMAKVTGSHLEESYNQYNQRSEYFQADLEKYNEKQRTIVQKAVDSGILNNTRKTHDFVDLVAKIGAETGTDFDFTDNKKLAESGFAVDGVTVNGFTDGKTVTVNIHSAKALNTVVGHEIMHVLEGTELAGNLQEKLFAYAESKGELAKRRGDLEKLYAGRDANIDSELTADLVGDYIFSDIDFVRSLKAGDRNLFQRVFDEIKHLVKLATAGSKEARELEKVKKLFEDVYREAGRPGVETVTDKQNAKGLDTEQEVDFSLSRDAEFSDNAIAKNNTTKAVDPTVMEAAKTVRSKIADRMMEIKEKGLVGLPEDIEGDTFLSNSSYGGSMENTTVCPRSLAAEAFMNAVSEAVGRPLTVQEQIYVSQDLMNRMGSSEELRSNMLALECVYCYVAMDRKAQREYLGKYLEQRDAVVEQLKQNPEISTAGLQKDHRALAEHFKNKKSPMPQLTEIGKLYNEYLNGRKPTKNTYKRFKMWVDAYKNGARMVSGSDLANMERLMKDIGQEFGEDLRPQIEDALDYAQKASWAKKRSNYVAYDGKILRMSLDRINKLNSHYGLRMYSFSDFHPAFVLENMQMITDASVRGLKMLGYTKELDFVKIFAPSGMNINISTFGFNSGGNVYENNIMGANWQEAQELRKQYPNVGITYIATDDTQVRWAMEQDWIDVVIPFHMVKTGEEVAEHYGFTNYTKESADQKTKDWKKGNQESIAPTQHNNDLETYLQALAENNLQPRFERFMTNEDDTPNPNYMKLVNECRQSAAESKPVQPIFNEEAAMEAMAKLEANGYNTPIGGSVDRMYEIAADVAEDLATDAGKKLQASLSQEQMEAEDTAYDPKQIYGKDVRMEAPVAAQTKTGVAGIEGPLPDQMPKAQPIEGPLREKVKAAPAMEAPTAAEMPKAQTVEAPMQEAKREAVETKAPKDGMEPVVSPKMYRPDEGKLKPKAEDMSQEEREYRDSMEDKPAETFRDVMEKRLQSLRREIEENRRNKQTVAEQYDEKIQSLKDEFVALKNKNTKHAQDTLRSISRNQQLKETRMAEYDKRINDLTKRVQRTQERIDSDTGRADWKQGKLDKIDAKYEEELEALETRQKEQRRELETRTASKEQYFADRALELYDELSTLKKGVKASEDLAYFMDRGHTWNAIKSALLLVKDKPSGIANPHFGLEKIVRERLEQQYNDALAELADLDTQQAMDRKALEDAIKKEKATLQASQIKKTKMEQYQAESAELAGNTATWKDKKMGFGYSMQTMRRYLREVVRDENGSPDIARADAIYEYLQGTYNQNEAALKREAKKRKDQIRELGLNKYEDEYGAMLGELKYNPESQSDAELAYRAEEFLEAHKDKIDLEKTNKAIETLRSEYDELIELLNNALREQGFREIPYRKGYFPHFMEPSQNFVQKLLNWKPKNNEIPTSIAGMTEEFNPQRSWQGFDKERKGNATVYSLQKGYNQYLDGALDWIYHIADIQRRRAFENHIREVHTDENARKRIDEIRDSDQYDAEDAQAQIESVLAEKKNTLNNLVVELRRGTNTLAGKKSSMDRSVEADFGRWVYSTMTNVANRSSANMVAGNLASAATNVIPIVQSWTQVKPRNSFKAVKQIIQAMNNDDGLVEKSAFLTNRLLQNESLYKDTWDKIGDAVSLPMEAVDKFTSQVVWRSKYIENIEKGMSEEAAIRDADQFAENVIAGRSRGNMPTIFDSKNPIYKVLTAFQLEVANQYGYFFKDVPTDTKAAMKGMTEKQKTEEKTKLAIGLTNMLLGTYVYNAAMEFITGNTPATDPIRILEGIIRDIWGEAEDDDEEEMGEEIANVAGSALEELAKELPYIGGLIGGGRISSAAAIPYGDPFNMIKGTMEDFGEGDWANLKKEWLNMVYYGILPMGGGQIKKINEGIGMYLDPSEEFPFLPKIAETPGSYTTSGNLRYAVEPTFWNVLQSILFGQYANANAREYFNEGRSPLSPNQVEKFSSVDMSMSEYWDYRDALKAAGDKVADKIDVVMDLDLPIAQKNILANNIADRKDPIDLTGAEDFGNFAEFDFYSQNPEKYKFLNNHGISWNSYTGLSAEEKDAVDKLFNAPKKTEFLLKKGITAAQWKDMDEEAREELNFEYNNPEKYSFLKKAGISVEQYKGFDKATRNAWDTMAENPKKYEFLKKQGVTVDQYKMFNDSWKEAWNWAYKEQDGYLLSKGVTDDLYAYRKYMDKIAGISGDKNEKGNTISGSKKKKVWAYIQTLPLSDGAKMLLFKEKYPDDDTYNKEVARYVLSLAMTYKEKKRILERMKFKVDSNGKITW